MKKAAFFFLLTNLFLVSFSQLTEIKKGLTITKSVSFLSKEYAINADSSLRNGVIMIEGNDIILDFKKIVLTGSNDKKYPEEFYGVAIWIRNSKNVTIKNLTLRGYKVAIRAENTEGLNIESCDLSYNYRQHLNSTPDYEDISDWLSHHKNEGDEWLRYGAAIYLRNCNNGSIKKCKITNGQNALMMNQCNGNSIVANFFCFNSGLGIGMYRSSNNQIIDNNLDWNVRGYSHGVYQRGQDSAGILIYEQSNDNVIQDNSVTHSGDGLFLWAGQYTMDTGKGGCNGNQIVNNDFSFAPTNGIEVTFSSNIIKRNKIEGCTYGIWGGYSYKTEMEENYFKNNRTAIGIEHGQENVITKNIFLFDSTADLADKAKKSQGIRLWGDPVEPSDWGYPKSRNTNSTMYSITENRFSGLDQAIDIRRTDNSTVIGNHFDKVNAVKKDSISSIDISEEMIDEKLPVPNDAGYLHKLITGASSGRKYIVVNEWGPYDFKRPEMVLRRKEENRYEFEILGPAGTWKLNSVRNVSVLTQETHNVPGRLLVSVNDPNDFEIRLDYYGNTVTDQFGNTAQPGRPYTFSYTNWQPAAKWEVKWFAADSSFNPYKDYSAYQRLTSGTAVNTAQYDHVRFNWWWEPAKGVPADFFATTAETKFKLDEGNYEIGITSDDGVKVFVDGNLLIDAWNPELFQKSDLPHFRKYLRLSKGEHRVRIEHYELSGFSCLTFSITKAN